jgi:hypothetical protein
MGIELAQASGNKDGILITIWNSSGKYSINFSARPGNELLFGAPKTNEQFNLYIFDVEGNLVSTLTVKDMQSKIISNLKRGNYSFEIFRADERVENGALEVK